MSSTVNELFQHAGLDLLKPVWWGKPVVNGSPGVYVIPTSEGLSRHLGFTPIVPISLEAVRGWTQRVPSIEFDGIQKLSPEDLLARLSKFWIPDERILYIGVTAKQTVKKRVRQYYNTPLGESRSHDGGHWLKTVSNSTSSWSITHLVRRPRPRKMNGSDPSPQEFQRRP